MRTTLDHYLDGALTPDQRAAVERQLGADPAIARLLASIRHERALRAAAYASFEPARDEARTLSANMMNALTNHQPAGYVGAWIKRGLAVAATIAIVAGSFAMGRLTATNNPEQTIAVNPPRTETQVVYRVMYLGEYGEKDVKEFASLDDANDFVNKLENHRSDAQVVATADLNSPGSF